MMALIWAIVFWLAANLSYLSARLNQGYAREEHPPGVLLWCRSLAFASYIFMGIFALAAAYYALQWIWSIYMEGF